jgi:hypothetical protein
VSFRDFCSLAEQLALSHQKLINRHWTALAPSTIEATDDGFLTEFGP